MDNFFVRAFASALCLTSFAGGLAAHACDCGCPPAAQEKPAVSSAKQGGSIIRLGSEENNTTISVRVGDVVEVALKSNPTTGYEWVATRLNAAVLKLESSTFDVPTSQAAGAATVQRMRFRVLKAGSTTLGLTYKRPWEEDDENNEKWSVMFRIRNEKKD